jgi:dephospho-CoA kinase
MTKNLGVLGPAGSGKGFAAKYLAKKYGYNVINMGNIVRALARKEHIKPTRANLEKIGEKYAKVYGHDFVIEHAIERAMKSKKPVIIDGIRKPIQAKLAKQELNAKLILIDASPEVRFERMKKRRRANFPKTIEIFKKEEKQEEKFFNLKKTFSMCDYTLDNSKLSEKQLYLALDNLIRRINK